MLAIDSAVEDSLVVADSVVVQDVVAVLAAHTTVAKAAQVFQIDLAAGVVYCDWATTDSVVAFALGVHMDSAMATSILVEMASPTDYMVPEAVVHIPVVQVVYLDNLANRSSGLQ